MSVIVTDEGFGPDDWTHGFLAPEDTPEAAAVAVDLASDADPEMLKPNASQDIDLIRVDFPKSADGRGFTIARRLRLMGFQGRLRARGHVLADQYAMARRSGFDEVEIDDDLAPGMPEEHGAPAPTGGPMTISRASAPRPFPDPDQRV